MPKDDADGCPASRAYPFFTMSRNPPLEAAESETLRRWTPSSRSRSGGARRDRTDDLLLAKQALSQLSYGPVRGQGPGVRDQEGIAGDRNLPQARFELLISDF